MIVRIHYFFLTCLSFYLFIFYWKSSDFGFHIHKIGFVFHWGMLSGAGNGKLDCHGLNGLFLWQNKKSKGRWLLALAKPCKDMVAESCLGFPVWPKGDRAPLGLRAARRPMWRKCCWRGALALLLLRDACSPGQTLFAQSPWQQRGKF